MWPEFLTERTAVRDSLNPTHNVIGGNAKQQDKLCEVTIFNKFDSTTRLTATYNSVKNIPLVKPTLKKYLYNFVETQYRRIDADEFTIATLLPVQRFKKESADKVWSDSRRMI